MILSSYSSLYPASLPSPALNSKSTILSTCLLHPSFYMLPHAPTQTSLLLGSAMVSCLPSPESTFLLISHLHFWLRCGFPLHPKLNTGPCMHMWTLLSLMSMPSSLASTEWLVVPFSGRVPGLESQDLFLSLHFIFLRKVTGRFHLYNMAHIKI